MTKQATDTRGCICRDGQTCAYHAMIKRIIDSGVSLTDRLAVVDFSTIAAQQDEAAIIRAELIARRMRDTAASEKHREG